MSIDTEDRFRLVRAYDDLPAGSPARRSLLAEAGVNRTQLANWRTRLGLRQCRCGRPRAAASSRCSGCRGRTKRDQHLRSAYGITIEDVDRMIAEQQGRCAACGDPPADLGTPSQRVLHVDHDHTTGVVRGLLCHPCNLAFGYAAESPDRLDALARYARRHA